MPSYQNRKSHCGDKTILRPSYLHNGISYTCKTTSLYWLRALDLITTKCEPCTYFMGCTLGIYEGFWDGFLILQGPQENMIYNEVSRQTRNMDKNTGVDKGQCVENICDGRWPESDDRMMVVWRKSKRKQNFQDTGFAHKLITYFYYYHQQNYQQQVNPEMTRKYIFLFKMSFWSQVCSD